MSDNPTIIIFSTDNTSHSSRSFETSILLLKIIINYFMDHTGLEPVTEQL